MTEYIGKSRLHLQSVDSTNSYLFNLAKEGAMVEGTVLTAHQQTQGRGQRNHQWTSQEGKNLICSILLIPNFIPPDKQFQLSKAIALGVWDFVKQRIPTAYHAKIKWANDIYVGDKKIAGILIENTIRGNALGYSVVGIGLNINQLEFDSNLPNPISLAQITHQKYDLDECLASLCQSVENYYDKLKNGFLDEINTLYINNLYRYNEFHWFEVNHEKIYRKIVDVEQIGFLVTEDKSGHKERFDFGQIRCIAHQ
jgi:BirA family transcriptional regulator, biotin operon repressor / biotin---[acetyl-CoA-carboxylase] ligase